MSAPHIATTTIGISLPSFTIAKELPDTRSQTTRVRGLIAASPKAKAAPKASRRFLRVEVLSALFVFLNVCSFAYYLYGVNNLEALSFTANQTRKSLAQLQDKQRQFQIRIAEASASIRVREEVGAGSSFVAVGTPEFVAESGPAALTMR
jgi:hypothetical protein